MPKILNERAQEAYTTSKNPPGDRRRRGSTLFSDDTPGKQATFAALFQDNAPGLLRQDPDASVPTVHEPKVLSPAVRQLPDAGAAEPPSAEIVRPASANDDESGTRYADPDDADPAARNNNDSHNGDVTAPASTGSEAVGTAPDTIKMLNELLLIGGPSRLAASELRGGAGKPASEIAKETASSQAAVSRPRVAAEGDEEPLTNAEPGLAGQQSIAPRGSSAERSDTSGRTGADSCGPGQNNAGSVREERSSGDQHQEPGEKNDRHAGGGQRPAAPAPADALASLRSFAALNARAGVEPPQAVTPPARLYGPQAIAGLGASSGTVAQTSGKPAAQSAGAAQVHPPASSQMFRGITSAMKSEAAGGSALISLRPESLGEVKIRVDVRDGQVSAAFEAATPMARDLLNRSLVELRELLHSRGLTVDRLDVSLRDEQHASETSGPARMDAQQHARAQSGDPSQDEMGHTGGSESDSQSYSGGAGNNAENGAQEDPAWRPGHLQGARSKTLESAEPVPGHVGAAPVWHVDGLIDTLA
ncbi:MAG: flagellar hook-length control protein FliK [Pyrinomonadaceae bacterium]|nr:flagellar hook-length control protein FliK [Phycisphaerales bacterium]